MRGCGGATDETERNLLNCPRSLDLDGDSERGKRRELEREEADSAR